jgi:rhodanese-related sulfurtransferase
MLLRDRDTPIVFQCHHGVRSQHAAEYFRRQGFRNLYNLRGGIDALVIVRRYVGTGLLNMRE